MSGTPIVRPATAADFPAIAEAHRASVCGLLASTYAAEVIAAWAGIISPERHAEGYAKGRRYLVAEDGALVVGFAAWFGNEVQAVYVRPEYVRTGLGSSLLRAVEGAAAHAELVLNASPSAVRFYERHGWVAGEANTVPLGETPYRLESVRMRKMR